MTKKIPLRVSRGRHYFTVHYSSNDEARMYSISKVLKENLCSSGFELAISFGTDDNPTPSYRVNADCVEFGGELLPVQCLPS